MRVFRFLLTGLFLPIFLQAQSPDTQRIPGRLIVHHSTAALPAGGADSLFSRHGAKLRRHLDKLNLSVIDVPAGSEETVMRSLRASGQVREVEYDYYAKLAG